MTFSVRLLLPCDLPNFLSVNIAAFGATSALSRAMSPNGWSEARKRARIDEWTKEIVERPQFFLVGAFDDESGDIIAGARWEREEERFALARQPDVRPEVPEDREQPFNKEVSNAFRSMIRDLHDRTMGGRSCWHLHLLFSNPAHGRRGAGTALLRWGVKRADADGLPCYLDATSMGRSLYEKLGFEVKERAELDLKPFGTDDVNVTYSMVRPAKSMGSSEGPAVQEEENLIRAGQGEAITLAVPSTE